MTDLALAADLTHCIYWALNLLLTNCNCCSAAYPFTYCCSLLPIIWVALFSDQFFSTWSVIFRATNANPQPDFFQSHQHFEVRNITFSQM